MRKVATALVQEWLVPFRAEPIVKKARWVVQSVVEDRDKTGPLWERGIATDEYEARLDRAGLSWAIRATAGRGRGTILARLARTTDESLTFDMENCPGMFPDTLFDNSKLDQFLEDQGADGQEGLFVALLRKHGFKVAS